jgi:hypothetical protein
MKLLHIVSTKSSPEIIFDDQEHKLFIKGICTPENPIHFFQPVVDILEKHLAINNQLIIDIYLDYFNTGSSKCLLNLFSKVAKTSPEVKSNTIVNWIVDEDDSELKEAGEVFEEITGLKFNYISQT